MSRFLGRAFGRARLRPAWFVLACALGACADDRSPARPDAGARDAYGLLPAEVAGWRVTRGAAAGYVPDESCKECHEGLYESYQSVGMARSFYRLTPATAVEDFGTTFFQAATGFYYETFERDRRYYQKRYCKDDDGRPFAAHEVEIAWVIGSGHHARTYASQTAYGEMFELPVSWYAGKGWHMSPGYELAGHERFERQIHRGCMFCHNAYPEIPAGADLPGKPHVFPREMAHGIGCQRCHGPGARHIQAAVSSELDPGEIVQRIVNPTRLPGTLAEELCMSCHMQPDAGSGADSISRVFDKPEYGHRPDQSILDYLVYFDFGSEAERTAKLEINHHAHRMRQSPCFTASSGQLGCLSCHDPHRKVPQPERAAFYREKCLQCHDLEECSAEGMGTTHDPAAANCVACHMLEARPRDVVQATITDHYIRRKPPARDLTAPITPRKLPTPENVEVVARLPSRSPTGARLELHRALAKSVFLKPRDVPGLIASLREVDPQAPHAYLRAGLAIRQVGDHERAIAVLREGVQEFSSDPGLRWNLAMTLHRVGHNDEAREHVDAALAIERHPRAVELLGNLLVAAGHLPAARVAFEEALALRPVRANTWRRYAHVLEALGDHGGAVRAFRNAMARNPDIADVYRQLFRIHLQKGEPRLALRALSQGASRSLELRFDLILQRCSANPALLDTKEAVSQARRTVSEHPNDPRAHLHLALAHTIAGRLDAAAASVRRARSLGADPASCTGLSLLAALRNKRGGNVNELLTRYRREMRTPSSETLRGPIRSILGTMFRLEGK